jgi:hypothetical protein
MIEQNNSSLTISFPTPEAARAFAQFLTTLVNLQEPASSGQPSGPGLLIPPLESSIPDFQGQARSQHVVLTEERQEQLFNQRQNGQSAHSRLLRAQTTLRDGVLPFSKPGQTPAPSGQPSPRQRAAAEGGFADGAPVSRPLAAPEKKSKLRPKPLVAP